jgi:two-component system phosphate regulon response regulator PhoB
VADSTFNILVVEDEPVICELIQKVLADPTVEVDCASNGAEGVKRAKSRRYHLILMDVVLPELDGVSACRLLKGDPKTAGVPLYMLTAKTKEADVEAATRAGADGYIVKPFRGSELKELVSRLRAVS